MEGKKDEQEMSLLCPNREDEKEYTFSRGAATLLGILQHTCIVSTCIGEVDGTDVSKQLYMVLWFLWLKD